MPLPAQFPLPLKLEWTGPQRGRFEAPFAFESAALGRITIEAGFDTDFASIPRVLWNIYPPDGPYAYAAFIHDALYWHQATQEEGGKPVTREQADAVLLEGMTLLGIGWVTRHVIHRAVRLGGWKAWADNARKRRELAMDPVAAPQPAPETIRPQFRHRRQ